jgi:hypothetical protein
MHTLRGEMDESQLRKEIIEEVVPCGRALTTKFFALNDVPLSAGQWEPYGVDVGSEYIAAIVSSGTGVLYITRLK